MIIPAFAQNSTLTVPQLKKDFKVFRGILEEMHAGIYWYSSKAEMDQAFDQVAQALNKSMTEQAFFQKLASITAKIKCGHTWIATSKPLRKHLWEHNKLMPVQVKIVQNKMYCFTNVSDNQALKPGNEILQINHLKVDSLIKLMNYYSPGDGYIDQARVTRVQRYFPYFYTLYIDQPSQYQITFLNKQKQKQTITLAAEPLQKVLPKRERKRIPLIQLKFIKNPKVAVLKVIGFDNWKIGKKKYKFKRVLEQCFAKIDSAKVDNLIIDVRNNHGGVEKFGMALHAYLTDKPFHFYKGMYFRNKRTKYRRYTSTSWLTYQLYKIALKFDKLNDSTYALKSDDNMDLYHRAGQSFKGKVYVLINRESYSTTGDFAAMTHYKKLATFVGTETAGGYYGNTSDYEFEVKLPNSKIRVGVPLCRYETNIPMDKKLFGRGTIPHHRVEPTMEDILNKRDVALEYTLQLIKKIQTK
ncbi:hypothetical protein BKI52_42290 [marine bacterium AO1-C]|nr:hypothetical protein BKI52_42290 [marine bacterium AO1-C]